MKKIEGGLVLVEQTIFDLLYPKFKVNKPIRLITLFSGYDSQALALKYLGVDFTHYKTCEWAIKSIQALNDLHFQDYTDYSESFDIDYIKEWLLKKGISQNYNDPLNEKQINRLSEKQARTIFNNIVATHNLVNIQQVKDEDFNKIAKNQSDSSLYHLAGDSIVVNVLMAIFKELL